MTIKETAMSIPQRDRRALFLFLHNTSNRVLWARLFVRNHALLKGCPVPQSTDDHVFWCVGQKGIKR